MYLRAHARTAGGAAHIAKHPRDAPIDRVPDCTPRCLVRIDHHSTSASDLGAYRKARAPPIIRTEHSRAAGWRSHKVFGALAS